jgi:hypothetical protein
MVLARAGCNVCVFDKFTAYEPNYFCPERDDADDNDQELRLSETTDIHQRRQRVSSGFEFATTMNNQKCHNSRTDPFMTLSGKRRQPPRSKNLVAAIRISAPTRRLPEGIFARGLTRLPPSRRDGPILARQFIAGSNSRSHKSRRDG